MVLAIVTKLFSSSQQHRQPTCLISDAREGGSSYSVEMADTRRPAKDVEQVTAREALRPPYIHVRTTITFVGMNLGLTVIRLGNARGRNWRDDWRHAHAFTGHGQDTPTGRSAHAAKVHFHGFELLHHFSARRNKARIVWRRHTGVDWLLLWNGHILRHIRMEQENDA